MRLELDGIFWTFMPVLTLAPLFRKEPTLRRSGLRLRGGGVHCTRALALDGPVGSGVGARLCGACPATLLSALTFDPLVFACR